MRYVVRDVDLDDLRRGGFPREDADLLDRRQRERRAAPRGVVLGRDLGRGTAVETFGTRPEPVQ